MGSKKKSRGSCSFCGRQLTKSGMAKHLQSCEKRNIQASDSGISSQIDTFYHLQIEDAWEGFYWLHLEMPGTAVLKDLDDYLRAIWLDCCDHLSEFSLEKWGDEVPMDTLANRIFEKGTELFHIYDFGTSSETKIKVVSQREGRSKSNYPILLMARNSVHEAFCTECGERASWLCLECVSEYYPDGPLCDQHAKIHTHQDYGEIVAIINSPRMGMCGYEGPAEPPY